MSCPTCSHTMQNLGIGVETRAFFCPRCGTIRVDGLVASGEWKERETIIPKIAAPHRRKGGGPSVPKYIAALAAIQAVYSDEPAIHFEKFAHDFHRRNMGECREALDKVKEAGLL